MLQRMMAGMLNAGKTDSPGEIVTAIVAQETVAVKADPKKELPMGSLEAGEGISPWTRQPNVRERTAPHKTYQYRKSATSIFAVEIGLEPSHRTTMNTRLRNGES